MRTQRPNLPFFVNGGKISMCQSAIYATAEWANDMERRLLRLGCGEMLDRTRHLAWAEKVVAKSTFLMSPSGSAGYVLLPSYQPVSM